MDTGDHSERFDAKAFLAQTPTQSGVYDMRNEQGQTLYIGKAKNLKNRLASYFRATGLTTKTMALVSKIHSINLTVTRSETEALILEQNMIKDRRPQYNILLKDDKSYPYIYLSTEEDFPAIAYQRGKPKSKKGDFFGPYPSSWAVRESLNLMQKVFKLRQCDNNYYRNRARPCLQYQINRCKAPCVNLVDKEEYAQDVSDTKEFLEGKSQLLIRSLIKRMEVESGQLNFEQAAELRDQINHLRQIQSSQSTDKGAANADIIGMSQQSGSVCFDVLFVRGGRVLGHKSYFPNFKLDADKNDYLAEFLGQFYINLSGSRDYPSEIIIPSDYADADVLEEAIAQVSGKKVQLKHRVRGERANWLQLADKNAVMSLESQLASKTHSLQRTVELSSLLSLTETINRMECFDISHTFGEETVASCVVFGQQGPLKSEYRRFNVTGIEPGDDYAAMRFALHKRYKHLAEYPENTPDVIIIDGGKGQLGIADEVMNELSLQHIPLLGVAKGISRKPGLETLLYKNKELPPKGREAALLLIQQIRDEAHRFAISGHRQKRDKARQRSPLESIPGVGARRRSALLKFFGGRHGIIDAPVEELVKVEGISRKLAEKIYEYLHSN